MKQFLLFTVLLFTALFFLALPARADDAVTTPTPVPNRDEVLEKLAPIIAACIARRDTEHPIFHGCLDWHSAVHGHWALLRIARVTEGQRARGPAVDRLLSPELIAREAQFLKQHPGFERPYGRAWFLRLAAEFELWADETHAENPQRLRAVGDQIAQSLLELYKRQPPSPAQPEYENSSWALAQLHAYAVHCRNSELRSGADQLIRAHMLKRQDGPRFSGDVRPEFFSRHGNWLYLIVKTQDSTTVSAFLGEYPLPADIGPVRLQRADHHLGMIWSRAWALRALSRAAPDADTRRRADSAYLAHVAAGLSQHGEKAGNFMAYDHWVPQFAVYALTE